MKQKTKQNKKTFSKRRVVRITLALVCVGWLTLSIVGDWFVHHPAQWHAEKAQTWPLVITTVLTHFGERAADITDGCGITGSDAVYTIDTPPPTNTVFFAGAPRRTSSSPLPNDIQILRRRGFTIGYSPSLRHPVWVAYRAQANPSFPATARPSSFTKDPRVKSSPRTGEYKLSGYDRGHMAPNHAIVIGYGEDAQRDTFLTSNIAPQRPNLNRGPWRNVEMRIADLWTQKYGDVWVIVGALPATPRQHTDKGIDIPWGFYQIIVAQSNDAVRALALIMPQDIPYRAYPRRSITSIDAIEKLTGLDFLAELEDYVEKPLEAEVPTRLWPVRFVDVLPLITDRFKRF